MEIGEAVCVKSGSRKVTEGAVKKDEEGAGFEVANIMWPEIGRALMDELGSVFFTAGKRILQGISLYIRELKFTRGSLFSLICSTLSVH